MKRIFFIGFTLLLSTVMVAYSVTDTILNGDDDYARLSKAITFTALTQDDSTEVVRLVSDVWDRIAFSVYFTSILDTCRVYYEGSHDNEKWFMLDSNGPSRYVEADSLNNQQSSGVTYYKIFEHANLFDYYRIRIDADSTVNMSSYMTIGSN